jgi:hypothetical protein
MYKILTVALVGILVAGCSDLQRYRYPCQDHKNWDKPECKKPICEIHRDCPEHIFSNGTSKAVLDYIAGQEAIQIVNNRAAKKGENK